VEFGIAKSARGKSFASAKTRKHQSRPVACSARALAGSGNMDIGAAHIERGGDYADIRWGLHTGLDDVELLRRHGDIDFVPGGNVACVPVFCGSKPKRFDRAVAGDAAHGKAGRARAVARAGSAVR